LGAVSGEGAEVVAGTGEVAIVFRRSSAPYYAYFADRLRERITLPLKSLGTSTAIYAQSQLSEFEGPKICGNQSILRRRLACDECPSSLTDHSAQPLLFRRI